MIAYIKGKVVLARFGLLIIETGGIGYRIVVSPQIDIKPNIVDTQEDVELFIHEHIREDADEFYGFLSYQELELFERLITVSGVGPKAGILIMAAGKTDRIVQAILTDDLNFFTAISGIGKKVAAKIILELKSKIGGGNAINVLSGIDGSEDLIDALMGLGYKRPEISAVLTNIPVGLKSVEDKVRWCLSKLAKA